MVKVSRIFPFPHSHDYYFTEFKLYWTLIIINFNIWRLIWEKEERLGLRRWLIFALWNFKTCPKMGNGHAHNFSNFSHMYSWWWLIIEMKMSHDSRSVYQTALVGGIRTRVFIMIRITWFCKNKLIKIRLMILFCLTKIVIHIILLFSYLTSTILQQVRL